MYDFIIFDLGTYDLILGLDWLTHFCANIFCDQRRIELTTPSGEKILHSNERFDLIPYSRRYYSSLSCLLATLTISDELSEIQYPPVVSDFPDIFPDDISGLPPVREINFRIDLIPGTQLISIPPYRLGPVELQ